jgi:Domain of Unknown Function (DUF349)
MDLLERFRRHVPRWENPDPGIRAEGVREDVRVDEQELLARIASEDTDPRVRKAAVRKLVRVEALVQASADADDGVREAAAEALLSAARGSEPEGAARALAGLREVRQLASVAREAALPAIRLAAVERVSEGRPLTLLARLAEDPAVRSAALERLEEAGLIAEVALKCEHKATALAAVDLVKDIEVLSTLADRAAHKAAARRARARLEELSPAAGPSSGLQEGEATSEAPEAEEPGASSEADEASESMAPAVDATVATATVAASDSGAEPEGEAQPELPASTSVGDDAEGKGPAATGPESESPGAPREVTAPDPGAAESSADRDAEEQERRERAARAEGLAARLDSLAKTEGLALRDAEGALREARSLLGGALPGRVEHRLRAARAALFARAQELREADEWTRWANAAIQEELCRIVEGLAERTDLERVTHEVADADRRWHEARLAPRDQAEALRQRYQAARSAIKPRLDAYLAKRAEEQAEHLKEKLRLCERAEALADSREWLKVAGELKDLQARWKTIGGAAPRDERAAWKRFHAACDRFFTRRQEDLRSQKEAWAGNLARKEDLCVRAEALAESTEWEKTASEIRRLQAEWKEVGPVRRNRSEAVWLRFRKACDTFFDRYKKRDELDVTARKADREALCLEMERLVPEGAPPPEDLASRVAALMARARQAAALPVSDEEALTRRLVEARNSLVGSHPQMFAGTDLDPEANRARREKLCARVEALAASAGEEGGADLSGDALARRLKEALASNTIGGRAEAEARRKAERAEVESARAAWKRLGPVPGEAGQALDARFNDACARFLGGRRGTGVVASVR